MSDLTNPHDKFFKETFSRIEVTRVFFANYLPEMVTAVLNLDSLELQSGSFVDPDLQEQFADLLYRANLQDDSEADLARLVEHVVLYGRLLTHTWLENVDSKSAANQL